MANVMKRKRDPTFSAAEKMTLIELVEKYFPIAESKKTDASSIRYKNEQWGKIAAEFNSLSINHSRDVTVLKKCWENLKKRAKQEQTLRNQSFLATGGGLQTNDQDPVIDRVLEVIQARVSGYVNVFDSDESQVLTTASNSLDGSGPCPDIKQEKESGLVEVPVLAADWSQYSPNMLRQNINSTLAEHSPPLQIGYDVPESEEAFQEQQASVSTPRVAPINVPSSSRRRLHLTQYKSLNTERANLIINTTKNAQEEHAIQMEILEEMLKQERIKTEQEEIRLKILKIQLGNLEI